MSAVLEPVLREEQKELALDPTAEVPASIPSKLIDAGTVDLPAVALQTKAAHVGIYFYTTEHIEPGMVFAAKVEISYDQGKSWEVLGGFGRVAKPDGSEFFGASWSLRQGADPSLTMIRATTTVNGKPFNAAYKILAR